MAKKKLKKIIKKASKGVSVKPKSSVPLQPLFDRVVVKISDREERTASGIYIPETAREEKPEEGVVIAVGPGRWDEDGESRIPMSVSVGDRVMFSKYSPEEIKVAGETYLVVKEESILAIIS